MTGATIRVDVEDATVREAVAKLLAAGGDMRGAMLDVGEALLQTTRERFARQQAPGGTPWAPISREWRETKQRRGHDTRILTMRGHLSGEIAYQAGDGYVEVGSNKVYAAIHQFGGPVTHYARSQKMHFRWEAGMVDGNPLLLAGFRHRFASAKQAQGSRWITIGEHTVTMPARPFLPDPDRDPTDRERILDVLTDFLAMAAGPEGIHAG